MALSKDDILEAIASMSVMEVVELVTAMEEKFGVSAQAAVAVAAPAAGGDAGDAPAEKDAFDVMLTSVGEKKVNDFKFNPTKKGYAIKVPVFSFDKFPNVNKELGPEMKSTGESIYFIDDLNDDYFTKVYSERNLYLSR